MPLVLLFAKIVDFWAVAVLFGGAGFVLALRRGTGEAGGVLRAAAIVAAASGTLWFAAVFSSVTEDVGGVTSADAWSAFLSAPFAVPWLLRLVLCAAALAIVAARTPVPFCILGTLFAADQAWLGHAASVHGATAATSLACYTLHVLGGFAWVGALVMLCVTLRRDTRRLPDALALFSTVGIGLVALIAATGVVNAALRGLDLREIGATPYGRLLVAKLLAFATMLALAVTNRRHRTSAAPAAGREAPILVETMVGVLVIALAALLGLTAPP